MKVPEMPPAPAPGQDVGALDVEAADWPAASAPICQVLHE